MSSVLVTGAGGFIGRQLVAQLADAGHQVHAVGRTAGAARPGVRWHVADLLDPAAAAAVADAARAGTLVHLAWCTDPRSYRESPENLAWTEASLRLLRAFAAAGGRRAVLAGSVFEYDWSAGVCVEAGRLAPGTLYGTCKCALAGIAAAAAPALGLSLAWARIFWLYGPHEQPGRLVSSLIGELLAGRQAPVSAGTQQRDFLHVADVAGALAALAFSDAQGAVNIGSGEPVAVREVTRLIGSLLGREELIVVGGRPAAATEPPLVVADVARLRDEVGYTPRFGLESGLRDAISWWRAQPG